MDVYEVTVRNDLTGELGYIDVMSGHHADAQVRALSRVFHEWGWRKVTALTAVVRLQEKSA